MAGRLAQDAARKNYSAARDRRQEVLAVQRGPVIADVTDASMHSEPNRPMGDEPDSFLADLGSVYEVTNIAATQFAGMPALRADVLSGAPWPHLDGLPGPLGLQFPSRIIVADAGPKLVLVQIWAATDVADLDAFLPIADEFVEGIDRAGP